MMKELLVLWSRLLVCQSMGPVITEIGGLCALKKAVRNQTGHPIKRTGDK